MFKAAGKFLKEQANVDLARLKQLVGDNYEIWRGTMDSDVGVRDRNLRLPAQMTNIGEDLRPYDIKDLPEEAVKNLTRGEKLAARVGRYPLRAAAGLGGIYIADQFMGKPVEGVIDAVTLGLTNFRENETRGTTLGDGQSVPYAIPYAQGTAYDANGNQVPNVSAPVPAMDEKTLAYQIKRQRDNIAVNSLTLRELEAMQNQSRQQSGYYG